MLFLDGHVERFGHDDVVGMLHRQFGGSGRNWWLVNQNYQAETGS
jgi:hypothetical protein